MKDKWENGFRVKIKLERLYAPVLGTNFSHAIRLIEVVGPQTRETDIIAIQPKDLKQTYKRLRASLN